MPPPPSDQRTKPTRGSSRSNPPEGADPQARVRSHAEISVIIIVCTPPRLLHRLHCPRCFRHVHWHHGLHLLHRPAHLHLFLDPIHLKKSMINAKNKYHCCCCLYTRHVFCIIYQTYFSHSKSPQFRKWPKYCIYTTIVLFLQSHHISFENIPSNLSLIKRLSP